MYYFGFGDRPLNLHKAFDYFCRAERAGSAAAANNRVFCRYMGSGCRSDTTEAAKEIIDIVESDDTSHPLRLMALVRHVIPFCLWLWLQK
jgi:hypothetical protein